MEARLVDGSGKGFHGVWFLFLGRDSGRKENGARILASYKQLCIGARQITLEFEGGRGLGGRIALWTTQNMRICTGMESNSIGSLGWAMKGKGGGGHGKVAKKMSM